MNLDQYRQQKSITFETPIKCIISKKRFSKKNDEIVDMKVSLYQTVGLAHDQTIIFLAKDERGERFAVNEKQIK